MSNALGDTGTRRISARCIASRRLSPCSSAGVSITSHCGGSPLSSLFPPSGVHPPMAGKSGGRRASHSVAARSGSKSASTTRCLRPASQPAALVASVVLPLPPFGLATTRVFIAVLPEGTNLSAKRTPKRVSQLRQDGEQRLDRSGAEADAARAAPAHHFVGKIGVVLERHFESQREATKRVAYVLRGEREVDLGVLVVAIAVHILKIGTRALERGDECALQRVLLGRETGQPLATVDKHVGQTLVAVHVEKGVDTGFVHRRAHAADFGTALRTRRRPLAIEIGAGSIGAQIAAH